VICVKKITLYSIKTLAQLLPFYKPDTLCATHPNTILFPQQHDFDDFCHTPDFLGDLAAFPKLLAMMSPDRPIEE
jgi:hypothetical protein